MATDLRISGISSGIDTKSWIEAIMKKYSLPVDSLKVKQESLQVKKDAWRDVNTRMANLLTKISDLKLNATFKGRSVTTTDDKKVTGTATSEAVQGTYTITVSRIAQAHKVASDKAAVSSASGVLWQDSLVDSSQTDLAKLTANLDTAGGKVALVNNAGTYQTPGTFESINKTFTNPVSRVRLSVSEAKPAGTDISYSYSTDNGVTWTAVTPGTDITFYDAPVSQIKLKAELSTTDTAITPELLDYTIEGVTESAAANADTFLNKSGTFQVGGKNVTVTTSDSLNSIAKKMNDASAGVTASVVDNRLVIRENEMGAGKLIAFIDDPTTKILNQLGVLTSAGAIKTTLANAQNALFTVDDLTIERATNSISDVITGVTLELKDKTTENLKVTVGNDTKKAADAIKAFVDQYNSVMEFIADKMSYDSETKKTGDLFGDSSLTQLETSLRQMVSTSVSSGDPAFRNLAAIGINTSGKEAKLTIDEAKLTSKLNESPDKVAVLFGAAKTNVAYSGEGTTVSASSEQTNYSAASAIDGNTSSTNWGNNGGWMDNTPGSFPDYLEVTFASNKTIDEIKVFTLDSTTYPASTYGIKDFDLEYWDNGAWKTLKQFTGNAKALVDYTFDAVTTNKVRLKVNASNGANDYARVVDFQVQQQNGGFAARMYDTVYNWTRPVTGTLANKDSNYEDQIEDIKDRVSDMEKRLEDRETALWAQFTNMEKVIGKLNTQSSWLTQQIAALPSSLATTSK